MLALIEITPWHWVGFIGCILVFLAFDLGLFHRQSRVVGLREALGWTFVWLALALAFAGILYFLRGPAEAVEFVTGYFIEISLSMDNMFVIALIFAHFSVPPRFQHRVLFWGILGALIMRGVMIGLGVVLIQRFAWMLYVFGIFLILTGIKMLFATDLAGAPDKGIVVRCLRKILPLSPDFAGARFFTKLNGRWMVTPLLLVLLLVESGDLLFAIDSIPAIFGVTHLPFIIFTSNAFAILGLRSLYFLLAGAIGMFRYLKAGLSIILVLIGIKMLLDPHAGTPRWYQYKISPLASLLGVLLIIGSAIGISLIAARKNPGRSRMVAP